MFAYSMRVKILLSVKCLECRVNAYCVGGYEGYSSAMLQQAKEEIYETSGHC